MSMPGRLLGYLERQAIPFELVPHLRSGSSRESARQAHVDPERLAKCVLVEDEEGCLLAVLPASRRLSLPALREETQRHLRLAPEAKLAEVFADCEPGAVPPLGEAYGIRTIVDDRILHHSDIWFEAGDHTELAHVRGADFAILLARAQRGRFSTSEAFALEPLDVRGIGERERRLEQDQTHVLSLRSFGASLRREPEYEKDGHTGMILVKTPELRVVLEAGAAGARMASHAVRGPATLLVLEGALDVATPRGRFRVGEAELASLPPDEEREILCLAQSLFVLALSPIHQPGEFTGDD